MQSIISGRFGRVVYAHLEPEEDLYNSIVAVAREMGIKTGLVLSVTGALSRARLATAVEPGGKAQIVELEGQIACHGTGLIGETLDPSTAEQTPYVDVHCTLCNGGPVREGHLLEGSTVYSGHFTIALAEADGVELELHRTEQIDGQQVLVHKLRSNTNPVR
jgi:predicted DNA-binding protein with PD1-like motif